MNYRAVWTDPEGNEISTGWTDKLTAFALLHSAEEMGRTGHVENEKGEKVTE